MARLLASSITLLLWASTGLAQGAQGGAPAQQQQAATPASSQADQVAQGEAVVARATRLSNRVREMLSQAQREKDMIRTSCLNDKLSQINANLRNAEPRVEVLRTSPDAERRQHELTVLTVLNGKLSVLDQEANQCVGQDMYEVGATQISMDVDEDQIPDENGSSPPVILPPSVPNVAPPASGRR